MIAICKLIKFQMIFGLFLFLVSALVLLAIYRLTRRYMPRVIVNENGNMAPILAKMRSIEKPYVPTPWLINGHFSTVWGIQFRKKASFKPGREEVKFPDGGTVIIDWFVAPNTPDNAPLLVVCHTLGGGTREPCTGNMCMKGMKAGYKVVVATCRGANGSPITTKRLYDALRVDDLHFLIEHLKKTVNPPHIYIVGFSLGSSIAAIYSTKYDDVDAVMSISHPIDAEFLSHKLEGKVQLMFYIPPMLQSIKKTLKKNPFIPEEQMKECMKAKTLRELDNAWTSKELGLQTCDDYYRAVNIYDKVMQAKVPLLIFNAEDDPFTSQKFVPIKDIQNSPNVAYISTPEGGHVAFTTGMNGQHSYVEDVAIDYFKSVESALNK